MDPDILWLFFYVIYTFLYPATGYYGIMLAVRVSVRLFVRLSYVRPYFLFPDDNE